MPRLDVYQRSQSIPATAVSAPLRSENPIPATVQRIADQYGDIIAQHQESLRKRDNANKLLNISTAYDDDQRAFIAEEEAKTGPDTYDNIDRTKAFRDKQLEQYTKDIADPDLALAVKRHIYSRSETALTSLSAYQSKQRDEVTKQAIESASAGILKDAYAGEPVEIGSQRLMSAITTQMQAGAYGQDEAERRLVEGEREIAKAYLDGIINRNPQEAYKLIKSGQFNQYLDEKTIAKYDKEIAPKLKAYAVDGYIERLSDLMPQDEDQPFEIDKMMQRVDSMTDDPDERKLVRAQLKSLAADRVAASKERFEYNYGKIADAWELNPKLSTADVMKMPEFSKLTTAQQGNALAKIRGKIEHRDTTERTTRSAELSAASAARSAAAAERANVERKYDSAYYYWRSRPEELSTMNDAQFSGLRLEMGDKQFAHLQDDRKKLNSPEALADASNHANAITSVLDTIPGVNDSDKARYFTKLKRAIASEQKRVGKQLSNAEIENVVIENMQIHLVKEKGIFGSQKEKRKIEVLKTDQPAIPEAYQKRIDAVATKRGRVFSVPEQQKLYRAMLANETK